MTAHYRKSGYVGALLGAGIWVGCEFFRSEIYALHFPWITPGTGMPPTWLSPLIGVYGVSFLIVSSGLLIREKGVCRNIGAGLLFLVLASGFIKFSLEKGDVNVLAVQNEDGIFAEKLDQIKTAFNGHAVIILPELSLGREPTEVDRNKQKLLGYSEQTNTVIIAGGYVDSGEEKPYNAALTLDRGQLAGMHYKNRPVPLFNEGKKGTDAKSIKTTIGKIGTPVCFDCDHESVIRRMVADGASVILAPSLDAKHWSARQHEQHAELFRHRAAENSRWLVVAASSGRSQIIDSYGNRLATIPLMKPGVLEGKIKLKTGRTIYNRFGWLIGWCSLSVAGLVLILFVISGAKRKFMK